MLISRSAAKNLHYIFRSSFLRQTKLEKSVTLASASVSHHLKSLSSCANLFNSTPLVSTRRMSSESKIKPANRVANEVESVWVEFLQLALEEKPLNLGQGLPDYVEAAPDHVKQNLVKAVAGPNFMLNQYTRGFGHPRLINAISGLYSKLINRPINPKTEVLVTIGAYESIYCAINAFVDQGDEVIIIEPFFDCYEPMVRLAGGVSKFVPLRLRKREPNSKMTSSADWCLDLDELEENISHKTKMLILNTPHNPIGKVFSRSELEAIGNICKKHDLLVLSDEVYEHLVIDGEHVRIASLPGMWDRTITVGSAGKTFSVTGWKLGWCYGPEKLMKYVQLFHQNCIYTCPTPIQEAVAESFEIEISRMGTEDSYWKNLAASLREKRDYMVNFLRKANMDPTVPEGGYFLLANTSSISKNYDFSQEFGGTKDHKFVRWLSKHKKLQGIPPSAFYSPAHKNLAEDYIRLCYFKNESTLKEAESLIAKL
jgi:kynurenine--oxoglutarate transaminase/cysteine-S-conjugate beta-lyase/glutamine--phenylpyruvate transaminase